MVVVLWVVGKLTVVLIPWIVKRLTFVVLNVLMNEVVGGANEVFAWAAGNIVEKMVVRIDRILVMVTGKLAWVGLFQSPG